MLYDYHCDCGAVETKVRPVAQRNDPVVCGCGSSMQRRLEVPWVFDGLPRSDGARWEDGSGLPTKRMKNT